MGKKKEPSMEEAVKIFKDVMSRTSLSNYIYVNHTMISKTPKGRSVLILPDINLWKEIIIDEEIDKRELDIKNPDEIKLQSLFSYADNMESDEWINLDSELLFKGKIIKIRVNGFDYKISLNRDLIPLKLRKSEYYKISYRIFVSNDSFVLGIKKRFDYPLEDSGFYIMRLFKII